MTTTARTPEDTDRLFAERMNAGDVEGVVALYEPQATLVRQDGTSAIGTAAIRDDLSGLAALRPRITMHVVKVISGGDDVAVLYNDYRATGTAPDGTHLELSGRATEVVRRQADGTWRFIVDDPHTRATP